MRNPIRRAVQRVLSALGVLLIAAGLVAGVGHREVLDGQRFAAHADAMRSDPAVAHELGQRITEQILAAEPDLVAIRPLLESASAAVVSSSALRTLVRSAVEPLHGALVTGEGGTVVLRLADAGAVVVAALTTLAPSTAASLPTDLDVRLAEFGSGTATAEVIEAAHLVETLAWLLPLLGILCWLAAALVAGRSVHAATEVAWRGMLGVAALLTVLILGTEILIAQRGNESLANALLAAAWEQLDGALWRSTAVVAGVGLALAVAAMADVRAWLTRRPETPRARVARALVGLAVAGAAVLAPLATVRVAVMGLGVVAALLAVAELGPILLREVTQHARRIAAVTIAFVVLIGLIAFGAWPTSTTLPSAAEPGESPAESRACNGHVALCERRYNEVAFPATHNSMSAADEPGWFLAEQPTGVIGQLQDGIRVFLIDSWPGQVTAQSDIVANAEASRSEALAQARAEFGSSVVESALRLRSALNLTPTGPVEPYLCHALCELGSTGWVPLMQQVRAWMAAHPRDVVTFFIQDEVSPADTAAVFAAAGLEDALFTPTAGESWPTLGEMIATGRRLVVLHEHTVDRSVPWLLDGTVWSQDTPYDFAKASQFTCEHFRGSSDASLLLVNHWLNNPGRRIASAAQVNRREVLGARVERCRTERGQIPNYVAVDYYSEGDLFEVVDGLNGLRSAG